MCIIVTVNIFLCTLQKETIMKKLFISYQVFTLSVALFAMEEGITIPAETPSASVLLTKRQKQILLTHMALAQNTHARYPNYRPDAMKQIVADANKILSADPKKLNVIELNSQALQLIKVDIEPRFDKIPEAPVSLSLAKSKSAPTSNKGITHTFVPQATDSSTKDKKKKSRVEKAVHSVLRRIQSQRNLKKP